MIRLDRIACVVLETSDVTASFAYCTDIMGLTLVDHSKSAACLTTCRIYEAPHLAWVSQGASMMISIYGMLRNAICKSVDTVGVRTGGGATFARFSTLGCCEIRP